MQGGIDFAETGITCIKNVRNDDASGTVGVGLFLVVVLEGNLVLATGRERSGLIAALHLSCHRGQCLYALKRGTASLHRLHEFDYRRW